MKRATIGLAGLYAVVAVLTFGHAASRAASPDAYARCAAAPYCIRSDVTAAALASGFGAAIMWPLYWSWEAWS